MRRSLCALLILALILCGCGRTEPTAATGPETTAVPETQAPMVSLYDLRVAMLAAQPGLPEMLCVSSADENADGLFAYLSDLDYEKVEGFFLAYAADGKTANEIAVVCLKDPADLPALKASLNKHIQGRVDLYRSYAPELVDQAGAAELAVRGRYCALIMCADRAAVKAAFGAFLP